MNGRLFAGTKVEADLADGSEKFKKTTEKKARLDDDADENEEESKRLDQFGAWLEEQES